MWNDCTNSPHASKKLNKTTVRESRANDDVRVFETASSQVDAGQDESSQGESAETERCRVGELGGWRLVETGLEVTTECRKTDGVASVDMCERVAAIVVGLALLHAGLVGGMVVAIDSVDWGVHGLLRNLVLRLRGRHLCNRSPSSVFLLFQEDTATFNRMLPGVMTAE